MSLRRFFFEHRFYSVLHFIFNKFGEINKLSYLCSSKISRSGAVVARWAHNPKVVRSNRASATKEKET